MPPPSPLPHPSHDTYGRQVKRDLRGEQEPRYILRCHSHATRSIFGETNSILSFASFFFFAVNSARQI